MNIKEEKLKELLVGPGYITEDQFVNASKNSIEKKISISESILDLDFLKDFELTQVLANYYGYKFKRIYEEKIDSSIFPIITEAVAKNKKAVAIKRDNKEIVVGMVDPGDIEFIHNLEKVTKKKIEVVMITKSDYEKAMLGYKKGLIEEFNEIIRGLKNESIDEEKRSALFIDLVNVLIEHAVYNRASDVHIEPLREHVMVRYRIDGVLHEVLTFENRFLNNIVSRIKVISKMRIDEHMKAQDGKFKQKMNDNYFDIRVSVLPVTEGENIVMRILSEKNKALGLDDLGFSEKQLKTVRKAIKKPNGMILVTGPTGSGKTTSLYEMVKILNKKEVHISTIEDPVEYDIDGISQIQVNNKTNLTFSNGLRAIVRQDPDIIMVGEIRDKETIEIAINASLTGHLVFSTLHANDAVSTIHRLLDMGAEPYLVASTLNVIIAQRLIRKLCKKCRVSYTLSKKEKIILSSVPKLKKVITNNGKKDVSSLIFFKSSGCKACGGTGYSGRIGLFEILETEEVIRKLIMKKSSKEEIEKAADYYGMETLIEEGVKKALSGATSLSEVLRVSKI